MTTYKVLNSIISAENSIAESKKAIKDCKEILKQKAPFVLSQEDYDINVESGIIDEENAHLFEVFNG